MAKTIPAADDACPEEATSDVGACPDDEALLAFVSGELDASEVARLDTHLDGCAECRDVVAALQGGDLVSAPRARERAEPPVQVGRFVVEGPIGEGAMGVVLGARDPELARPVALKLLHPHRRDRRARLVREARAMAKLSHPNVVTVYEVGSHADGIFVAMERIDGTDLRAWLHAAKRSSEAILDAFWQAGQGLAAAHRAGLVHRDFKPENVLVQHDGCVKVGDFGLARDAEGPNDVVAGA
ncbi:MAG: protein kinase, partial [Myxococcales bacterium]|nr:protein kinase [Myxococcales bacterium]